MVDMVKFWGAKRSSRCRKWGAKPRRIPTDSQNNIPALPTHICITRPQWVNWTLRNNIFIEIHIFSSKKMHLKRSSAKWRPFCLSLNVFTTMVQQREKEDAYPRPHVSLERQCHITSYSGNCEHDNFRCRQWRKTKKCSVSVIAHVAYSLNVRMFRICLSSFVEHIYSSSWINVMHFQTFFGASLALGKSNNLQ